MTNYRDRFNNPDPSNKKTIDQELRKKAFSTETGRLLTSGSEQSLLSDAESERYARAIIKQRSRYLPEIDYKDPSTFAFYGSAEEYYKNSIENIYNSYPYDGSKAEKMEWSLSASYLDLYVLEHEYPKSTGHLHFERSNVTGDDGIYSIVETPRYIKFSGGPQKGTIYNLSKNRESNLKIDGTKGNTVEFWMKKEPDSWLAAPRREVILDINSSRFSNFNQDYGRITVELQRPLSAGLSPFMITHRSGSSGTSTNGVNRGLRLGSSAVTTASVGDGKWHHYAITMKTDGSSTVYKLFIDGEFNFETTQSYTIGPVPTFLSGTIGASSDGGASGLGRGQFSGSLDEFRYWKTARTEKEIGRFWYQPIHGGTDKDSTNAALGVYYKFNEGVTGVGSADKVVLDYSGRINNGEIINWNSSMRSTSSGISLSQYLPEDDFTEPPDPIMNKYNTLVVNANSKLKQIGKSHDISNLASLQRTVPSYFMDEDNGNFRELLQIMSVSFDDIFIKIKNLPKMKDFLYQDFFEEKGQIRQQDNNQFLLGCEDLNLFEFTGNHAKPWINHILDHYGLASKDLFSRATTFENYFNRSEKENFNYDIEQIKRSILSNIHKNLVNIFKTKGTEASFRNLIRCFGIDERLIRINAYGQNEVYELVKKPTYLTVRQKALSFRNQNYQGTLYNRQGVASGERRYITGSSQKTPFTLESNIIFPKTLNTDTVTLEQSSLFGMHSVYGDENPPLGKRLTWYTNDSGSFQVKVVRRTVKSMDGYFHLTSSTGLGLLLTSSYIPEIYDNTKWNISVRIGTKADLDFNIITPGDAQEYMVEFAGYSYDLDVLRNQFHLTASITKAAYDAISEQNKAVYVGSHKTNFTGTHLLSSDVKVLNFSVWKDGLLDEELKERAQNSQIHGRRKPQSISNFDSGQNLLAADSAILRWQFEDQTSASDDGRLTIVDYTSGSAKSQTGDPITGFKYPGFAFDLEDSEGAIVQEFIPSVTYYSVDNAHSSDRVTIKSSELDIFEPDSRPITYTYMFEKSMYQIASEEMVNFFAGVTGFNNMIGEPVNKYRKKYKLLEKVRNRFFNKVGTNLDFDKFIEYYRWIDDSLTYFLSQLVPASAFVSNTIKDVVESHMLERNKYEHKPPTIEFKDPNRHPHPILGINELLYDYEHGRAPVTFDQAVNKKAIQFGANGDGISIPDADVFSIGDGSNDSAFSFSAWVYIGDVTADSGVFTSKRDSIAGTAEYFFGHALGNIQLFIYDNNTVNRLKYLSTSKLSSATWHHITITYDGSGNHSGINVYVDGSLFGGSKGTDGTYVASHNTATEVYIGATKNPTTNTFEDFMADVVFYNKALSSAEASEVYNSGKVKNMTTFSAYSNIISWYKMGDDLDSTEASGIRDYVSTNHGTIVGSATIVSELTLTSDTETVTRQWDDSRPQDQNCLWQKERSEASSDRQIIKRIQTSEVSGSTYVRRALTKPYRLTGVQDTPITTGFNRKANKTLTYASILETGKDVVLNGSDIIEQPVCTDVIDPTQKEVYRGASDTLGTNSYLDMDSDLIFPFTLVSSSAGVLLDSLKDNLVIANNHIAIGISGEKPLQGTFAATHIGAKPHNKVRINTPSAERPEAYNLTISSQALTMSQVATNSPKSVFYDKVDGTYFANITNIKHTTGSSVLGNYESAYQVVHTSGRTNNNTHFVDDEGNYAIAPYTESTYLASLIDFALPVRRKSSHVMVNRFSAPGGPEVMSPWSMDREAAEFSVYNSLNYRNAVARLSQDRFAKEHVAPGGFRPGYPIKSLHFPRDVEDAYIIVQDNNDIFEINKGGTECPISISFWMKGDLAGTGIRTIARKGKTNSDLTWDIAQSLSMLDDFQLLQIRFRVYDSNGGTVYTAEYERDEDTLFEPMDRSIHTIGIGTRERVLRPDVVKRGQWRHIVITFEPYSAGDCAKIFIDGKRRHVTKNTVLDQTVRNLDGSAGRLYIGGIGDSDPDAGASAHLSNFMFFQHPLAGGYYTPCLSADDVMELYNEGYVYNYSEFSRFSECTAWWKLDKDATSSKGPNGFIGSGVQCDYEIGLIYRDKRNTNSASPHRTYRNPQRLTSSLEKNMSRGFGELEIFDNQFVQHQIPQHDFSYSWIAASAEDKLYEFLEKNQNMGHQNNFYVSSSTTGGMMSSKTIDFFTSVSFSSGSVNQPPGLKSDVRDHRNLDFVRLNSIVSSSIDFDTNTVTYSPTAHTFIDDQNRFQVRVDQGQPLPALILNMQGPYGWPTWKQIRGYEHPISRYESKYGKLSIVVLNKTDGTSVPFPTLPKQTPEITSFVTEEKTLEVFDEIMVTSRFNPLTLTLHSQNAQDLTLSTLPQSRLKSYWMNDETALVSYENTTDSEGLTMRQTQGPTTRIASIKLSHANQETKFSNYKIQNRIPDVKDIRMSKETKDMLQNFSNVFNEDPTIAATEVNYIETLYPRELNTYTKESKTRELFDFYAWNSDRSKRTVVLTGSNHIQYRSDTVNAANTIWGATYGNDTRPRNSTVGSTRDDQDGLPLYTVDPDDFKSTNGMLVDILDHKQANPTSAEYYYITQSTWPLDAAEHSARFPACLTASFLYGGSGGDNSTVTRRDQARRGEGVLQNDYSIFSMGPNKIHGTAPPAMVYNRRIEQHFSSKNSPGFLAGQAEWLTADQAGVYPNVNTYNDHTETLRLIGQDHSLVPEFICSDHVENLINKVEDFHSVHKEENFLSVTGAVYHSSSQDISIGSKFYKTYGSSDFMKYFGVTLEEVENNNLGSPYKLTLRCQAVKKFTPYTGFYPAERVVQIGQLFAKGYMREFDFISSSTYVEADSDPLFFSPSQRAMLDAKIRANLQQSLKPLFGPGILLNSIKSGMAVDYPLFKNPDFTFEDVSSAEIWPEGSRGASDSYAHFGHITRLIQNESGEYLISSAPNWDSNGSNRSNYKGTGQIYVYKRNESTSTDDFQDFGANWTFHEFLTGGCRAVGSNPVVISNAEASSLSLSQSMHFGVNLAVDDTHILVGTYRYDRSGNTDAQIARTGSVFLYSMDPSDSAVAANSFGDPRDGVKYFNGQVPQERRPAVSPSPFKFLEPLKYSNSEGIDGDVPFRAPTIEQSQIKRNSTWFGSYGLAVNKTDVFIGAPGTFDSAGVVHHYRARNAQGTYWAQEAIDNPGATILHFRSTPDFVLDGTIGEETIADVAHGHFGYAIEAEDDWLVVGAPSSNHFDFKEGPTGVGSGTATGSMHQQGGRVHIYKRNAETGQYGKYQTLTVGSTDYSNNQENSESKNIGLMFGAVLKLSGEWLAVTARNDSHTGTNCGRVHIFRYYSSIGEWRFTQTLAHPYPGSLTKNIKTELGFGSGIAIHKETMIINSAVSSFDGSPHVYRLNSFGNEWVFQKGLHRDRLWPYSGRFRKPDLPSNVPYISANGDDIGSGAKRRAQAGIFGLQLAASHKYFEQSAPLAGYDIDDKEIVLGIASDDEGATDGGVVKSFKIFSEDSGITFEDNFNILKNKNPPTNSFFDNRTWTYRAVSGMEYFTGSWINDTRDPGIPRLSGSVYKRVTFDELLDPTLLIGTPIYDNEPHPSASITHRHGFTQRVIEFPTRFGRLSPELNERDLGVSSFALKKDLDSSLKPYRLAINNFCAETVNFFIKDSKLATIESAPVNPALKEGSTYKMRVYVKNSNTRMYDRHSAFGPPVDDCNVKYKTATGETLTERYQHGHAPFVPPFLDPGATPYVEISFTPTETRNHTLEEITEGATYEYYNFKDVLETPGNNLNYQHAMSLSASIDFSSLVAYEESSETDPGTTLEQRKRWVIQSRWETPVLNFIDTISSASFLDPDGLYLYRINAQHPSPWQERNWDNYYNTRPTFGSTAHFSSSIGMWHQYGNLPQADLEGYTISIEPIPELEEERQLAQRVGFVKGDVIRQQIGQIKERKVVSEAVVAIPFLEPLSSAEDQEIEYYEISQFGLAAAHDLNRKMEDDFKESVRGFGKQSDRYKTMFQKYNNMFNTPGQSAIESVAYQLRMEEKFVIPPQFNNMMKYVFQFNAVFNKNDLANIWQNISPTSEFSCANTRYSKVQEDIGNATGVGDVEYISHFLPPNFRPMLKNMPLGAALDDRKVRWLVIKAKQRAEFDINNIRRNSLPGVERQYNVDDAGGTYQPTKELAEERYSFNWPYDFFSIVELVKLEGKVDMYRGVQIVDEE